MRWQTAHLDADAVAEFRAGLITGRRGVGVAAHLASCEHCAALGDKLADVSALLAAVPVPTMPDTAARRLDSVLTAEAAGRIYPERAGGDAPRKRRKDPVRRTAVRMLAPATAAVAVLGGAGYAISLLTGGHSPSPAAAASPSASPARTGFAGAAIAAPMRSSAANPALRTFSTLSVIASSVDYLPATAHRQLAQALTAHPDASKPASTQVKDCVDRVTDGTGEVIRVETARYQGQPATVVFAKAGGGYKAWVAGPACSRVVYETTLP
jgi:hypothetical protein